jgi:hypothetical protein
MYNVRTLALDVMDSENQCMVHGDYERRYLGLL